MSPGSLGRKKRGRTALRVSQLPAHQGLSPDESPDEGTCAWSAPPTVRPPGVVWGRPCWHSGPRLCGEGLTLTKESQPRAARARPRRRQRAAPQGPTGDKCFSRMRSVARTRAGGPSPGSWRPWGSHGGRTQMGLHLEWLRGRQVQGRPEAGPEWRGAVWAGGRKSTQ